MKVSLVVAEGVHQGKTIPITVTEFLIGRDPECQLRPASPQVSKKHCAIVVREGKVYVRDFGSTNGTFINDEQIAGDREVKTGDRFRAGPLAFEFKIELTAPKPATPVEAEKPKSKSSPVIGSPATEKPKSKSSPVIVSPSAEKPKSKSSPVIATPTPVAAPAASEALDDPDHDDKMAALLLGGDDGSGDATVESAIPDGTTAMDLPSVPGDKKDDKKKPDGDTSTAANAILQKYMRRPRT